MLTIIATIKDSKDVVLEEVEFPFVSIDASDENFMRWRNNLMNKWKDNLPISFTLREVSSND